MIQRTKLGGEPSVCHDPFARRSDRPPSRFRWTDSSLKSTKFTTTHAQPRESEQAGKQLQARSASE